MKKWWFVLILFFSSLTSWSQKVPHPERPTINITPNQVVNGWAKVKYECLGCLSFYYQIRRTAGIYEDGYYYYHIYLYSNSYYVSGFQASTYLSEVNFYLNEEKVLTLDYILVEPNQAQHVAWLKSKNAMGLVTLTWEKSIIY